MTVDSGGMDMYRTKRAKLGADPLNPTADVEALWARVSKSRMAISKLLMDQKCFAGVGNIYRAEILFVARMDPAVKVLWSM